MDDELVAGDLTLVEASGQSFRLVMKDGSYRDFESGYLVILPDDPLQDELLAWAEKQRNISIIQAGQRLQEGRTTCSICGHVVAADDLADHMADVHVDEEGIRQMAGLPPKDEDAPLPRKRR